MHTEGPEHHADPRGACSEGHSVRGAVTWGLGLKKFLASPESSLPSAESSVAPSAPGMTSAYLLRTVVVAEIQCSVSRKTHFTLKHVASKWWRCLALCKRGCS